MSTEEKKKPFKFRVCGNVRPRGDKWEFSLKIKMLDTSEELEEYIIGPWDTQEIAKRELESAGHIVLSVMQMADPQARCINLNNAHHEVH